MSRIVIVPLPRLTLSHHNIRRTQRDANLDQLAASIRAEGLINPLTGARIPPDDDTAIERIDVIAGGRRLRALQQLAERDELPESLRDGIPVSIVPAGLANEIGLAENTVREKMHAHDEFVAFRDLAAQGMPIEDIASRFGVAPLVVERRLRLANVAPEILQAFRLDQVTLEVMQAFALTDDWAVQRRIFDEATSNGRRISADQVRRAIAQREVPTTDKRVTFVGLDVYEAAGGAVRRDLFDASGGGYCLDETLLDQLVEERLQREAKAVEGEGWKFVRIDRDGDPWKFRNQCDRTDGKREKRVLSDAEKARVKEIDDRHSVLSRCIEEFDADDDNGHVELDFDEYERWEEERNTLEAEHRDLTADIEVYSDRQKAKSGCQVYVDQHGHLVIERGLIPREGSTAQAKANVAEAAATGAPVAPKTPTLAESMIRRLTAHRTLALQAALMQRRDIALKALAHGLLLNLFYTQDFDTRSPLSVTAKDEHRELSRYQFADVDGSPVMQKLDADIAELRDTLNVPPQRSKFWPWLLQQSEETVSALLALVAVVSLNTTSGHVSDEHPGELLAAALDIDYADYWQPTQEAFTNLVPKALFFEALSEAVDATTRARFENRTDPKDVLASEIAQHLVRARWLPKPLRRPGYKPGAVKPVADKATPVAKATKTKPTAKAKASAKPKPKPVAKKAAPKKPAKPAPAKKPAKRK
jgi:ParB family chromosome partitioning protein